MGRRLVCWRTLAVSGLALACVACGGGGAGTPTPPPSGPPNFVVAAAGDTQGYNILTDWVHPPDPLAAVRSNFAGSDLFVFNLEGPILTNPPVTGQCPGVAGVNDEVISGPAALADDLTLATVTVASIANNHILDCGDAGIAETRTQLTARGIVAVGAGANLAEACAPALVNVNGTPVAVVSYLAITPDPFTAGASRAGPASWAACNGAQMVQQLKAAGRYVIVVLHLHLYEGWNDITPAAHIALATQVIDAGADLVVAAGPHVPQGILSRNGHAALMSLGDFLLRPSFPIPEAAYRSVVARIGVTLASHSTSVELDPLRLGGIGIPHPPQPQDALMILQEIASSSATYLSTYLGVSGGKGHFTVHATS